jgi:hypothetical protein
METVLNDNVCKCLCHEKGAEVMHFMPCCEYTYGKYINEDGSIDEIEYTKVKESYRNSKIANS